MVDNASGTEEIVCERVPKSIKKSYFERLLLQKDPWKRHIKSNAAMFIIAQSLLVMFIIFAVLRFIPYTFNEPETFSFGASCVYCIRFLFMWLLIPEGPPILASETGQPLYATKTDSV